MRDALLGAGDAHRRAPLGQRPRFADRRDDDALGGHEGDGHSGGGQRHVEVDTAVHGHLRDSLPRGSAQMLGDRVGTDEGVAQRRGLLGVELPGLRRSPPARSRSAPAAARRRGRRGPGTAAAR